MKWFVVVDCVGIAVNVAAGIAHFGSGNTPAGLGWLAAATWCVACMFADSRASDWKNLAKESIDALGAHLGGRVVCVGDIKMDGEGKDVSGSEDAPEEITGPVADSLKGIAECTKEALHYIDQGNLEFSVSHGGVTLSVSIPEDDHAHAEGV